MFTKDSRILNQRLTVPLTSVSKAVGDVFKPSLNQIIQSLFANGEQGFAYDPNDLSTMFQDAAGTVPVTGAGQPVGLMFDKSKGLVLSNELVTNGDFTNGSAGWTLANGSSVTSSALVLSSQYAAAEQSHNVLNGDLIELSYSIVEASGTPALFVSGSSYAGSAITLNSSLGTYKVRFRVTDATKPLRLVQNNTGVTLKLDNISVKKVQGNHAYQTTSASRPILRQNAITGAYYLEFDGSDDFLVTNNIDFTGTDKVSLFTGVRKSSDAVAGSLVELSTSTATQNGSFHLRTPTASGTANLDWSSRGTVRVFATSPSVYTSPTSIVISTKGNISGDSAILRVNGGQVASSIADQGTGNFGNHPLYIGRRGGTENPFNGHIYGLIGVGKLASDGETAAIEKELAKRLGVTLNV